MDKFWSRIDDSGGPEACWPWLGAKSSFGHGNIKVGDKYHGTHRLMMELLGCDLTPQDHVCHKCDNPSCCNPMHLYVGSHATNVADREMRGRSGSGRVNAAKTHCPRGHPYTEKNTFMKAGSRNCRQCIYARTARWRKEHQGGGRHRNV